MRSGIKLLIVLVGLLFFKSFQTSAQVDRTFWFVAPEVTIKHSQTPAILRITAFDNAAKVKISMPANPGFSPIYLSVPANQQVYHEFTGAALTAIENGTLETPSDWTGWTPGTPFNKGLLIESDVDISVYYEIANGNNPDRFNLKGVNALGTDFYVPSQNVYYNWNFTEPAAEQINIVATEDNTQVTIKVTDDVNDLPSGTIGHEAGSTFTITLNKGQTYCLRSTTEATARNLGGTHITSTKPIAVTISDDSIAHPVSLSGTPKPGHYDLVGDQLIPLPLIGTEYIAINTLYNISTYENTGQKVFILATEDNTSVFINGAPLATLQEGEYKEFDITGQAIYITSSNPVYVYQFASVKYEIGSAILPNINCTGSQSVTFARIYEGLFAVQILTQKKNLGHFTIRDDSDGSVDVNRINNLDWEYVSGSAGGDPLSDNAWYAAVENMDLGTQPYTIKNDNGLFHLSVLDANGASMSYGYFSSYNSIRIKGPSMACFTENEEEKIILTTNQEGATDLKWYYDDETNGPTFLGTGTSIIAEETGEYWVEMQYVGCQATDHLFVEYSSPDFTLGEDREVCFGETVDFEITGFDDDYTFEWSPIDNNTNSYSFVPEAGQSYELSLTITDPLGCASKNTVNVVANAIPVITWDLTGNDICIGETISLVNPEEEHSFQWSLNGAELPGETNPFIQPTVTGNYTVTVISPELCSESYSQDINVRPLPVVSLTDFASCPGSSHTFTLNGYSSYLWNDGSTSNSLTLNQSNNDVWVEVTNEYNCKAKATAVFEWYNEQVFSFGADTSVCASLDLEIAIDNNFTNYQWAYSATGNVADKVSIGTSGNPSANNNILSVETAFQSTHQGHYYINATDNHGCNVDGTFNLEILPMPIITLLDGRDFTKLCLGDTLRINILEDNGRDFTDYSWYKDNVLLPGEKNKYLEVTENGTYTVIAKQANGCYAQGEDVQIQTIPRPDFTFFDAKACPGDNLVLEVADYQSGLLGDPEHDKDRVYWWHDVNYTSDSYTTTNEGTYKVTVYDKMGCFRTKEAAAEFYKTPEINLEDVSFCDNISYTQPLPSELLSEIISYQWDANAINTPLTVTEGGTHTLTIRDKNPMYYANGDEGCMSTASMELTKLPSPVFSLGADGPKCENAVIAIDTDPTFTRYEWNGNTSDNQTNSISVTTSGIYSLVVWNEYNCSTYDEVTVTANALPIVNIGDDKEFCAGQLTTLTVGTFPEIYWSNGVVNEPSITVMDGAFSVRVVDDNGCEAKDAINIIWWPIPTFSIGVDDIICPFNYPVTIEAPEGYEEYLWHTGSTARIIEGNLLDTVNIVKVRNEYNCWGMDSKIITYAMEPEYETGGDFEACANDDVIMDAGTHTYLNYNNIETLYEILTYRWNKNNALTDQYLTVNTPGEHIVEVFDGCFTKTDTFNVKYFSLPVITGLDSTYYAQITVLTDPNEGTQPFSYSLDSNLSQTENTFKKVFAGEHTIILTDDKGCETFTTFSLSSEFDIEVPNFFTPNSDGVNDEWVIDGIERFPEAIIFIYDRYGKLITKFLASEPPWDGTYMNQPISSDDYWYVIQLYPLNKFLKGNVSLKR